MKTAIVLLGIFWLLFGCNWQAKGQSSRYGTPRFAKVEFENDVLQLRKNDARDGNFTNGVRLDLMGNFWKRLPTRKCLDPLKVSQ